MLEEEESLIDKIMAVVNSTQDGQGTELGKNVSVIHIRTLEINMTQHSVYKNGREILLTNTEFKMPYFLVLNKGMALSKDQIYNYIWNGEYDLDDSNITYLILKSLLGFQTMNIFALIPLVGVV